MNYIFIVSDGTGFTAEQIIASAMTQFSNIKVEYIRKPAVQTQEEIIDILKEAHNMQATVIHTLVSDKMREYMLTNGRLYDVETIDLMGPLLSRLSNRFSVLPDEKPGLFHQLNDTYFRRVETMNFAFKHDDGLRTEELEKAEIILIGVSRTFKTPLCIYLAFKNWLVANVPIILDMKLPDELLKVNPNRVYALTTNARRLSELRQVRHEKLGENTGNYANYSYVKSELEYANNLFRRHPGWSIIKVTNKSIEEIASEIITLMRENFESGDPEN